METTIMARSYLTLFTVQNQVHDIGTLHEPLEEYAKDKKALMDLARYLGWNSWIWTFLDLQDFQNDWLSMEELMKGDLWTLSVPSEAVKWCALRAQIDKQGPVRSWFYSGPDAIRKIGDSPVGLVRTPIVRTWVSKRTGAKEAFAKQGLWKEAGGNS
jgi:hypothetical protein